MGSSVPFSNVPSDSRASSRSNIARLRRSYVLPNPFIISGYDGLGSSLKEYYQNILSDSENKDSGHTFGTVNMNFGGVNNELQPPDYAGDIRNEDASSHWVPNTTSPLQDGSRAQSIEDQKYTNKAGTAPFVGLGSSLSPLKSSESISSQSLDNLSLGSSTPSPVEPSIQVPQNSITRRRPSVRRPR